MNTKLKALKDKFFVYSMLRWGTVGMLTNLIDYIIFICLYRAIESVFLSNLISASVSTSINYLTNHKWTFRSDQNHSSTGTKYLINLAFWWLISTSIIKVLVILDIDPKIAKLLPLIVIVPVNYFVLNHFVFSKKN